LSGRRATASERLVDYLDSRADVRSMWRFLFGHSVPRFVNPLEFLGAVSAFLFVNQAVTGILLAMFYNGSTEPVGHATAAYVSIQNIMHNVPLGWVVRDLHYWGANAMVVVVFCHMLRVFWIGAYKKPRELTWVMGTILFLLTLLFAFTGYLLPWDQQSYWATMVGTDMPSYVPFIGNWLLQLTRGGQWLSGITLTRFYAVHMLVLPAALGGVLVAHLYLVFRHGLTEPTEAEERAKHDPAVRRNLRPFWPNTMAQMLLTVFVAAVALLVLALLFRAPLLAPADPLNKAHYQPIPAWYFYSIYYVLDAVGRAFPMQSPILSPIVIVGLPIILGAVLVGLPWLDRGPRRAPAARPAVIGGGVVGVALIVILTYLGNGLASGGVNPAFVADPTFSGNVMPVFQARCQICHSGSTPSGGLDLTSYAALMKMGVVVAGKPSQSLLYEKLTGQVTPRMPLGGPYLPEGTIRTIGAWIAHGAKDN
jgi:quinol-cytochrome oxidoreductase complex cytochrome b subunit